MTHTQLDYTPQPAPKRAAQKYTPEQRQKWRTPNTPEQPVLWLVAQALGGEIGLDPTADNDRLVPAQAYITRDMDCFQWPWRPAKALHNGTAFMNPPFDSPHKFLQALADNTCCSDTLSQSISLMKIGTLANQKTGTIIKKYASAFCCWGAGKVGRMAFLDCDGFQVAGADFDTVLVNFGESADLFCDVFEDWGLVAKINLLE